jgi:hypothetical protein
MTELENGLQPSIITRKQTHTPRRRFANRSLIRIEQLRRKPLSDACNLENGNYPGEGGVAIDSQPDSSVVGLDFVGDEDVSLSELIISLVISWV